MNVGNLNLLARTVRGDSYNFRVGRNLMFTMSSEFVLWEMHASRRYKYGRNGIDPADYDGAACLIGFSLMLAGKENLLLKKPEDDFCGANYMVEARRWLDLDDDRATELFYGTMSPATTGEDAYLTIRRLTINGKVEWFNSRFML